MRYWFVALLVVLVFPDKGIAQVNAEFKANNTNACGSLQVNFFDQSTSTNGSIISYSWDLSIANSSLQNPGAIYTQPGLYTVCLTVTDIAGATDTECKEEYIQIYADPVASFEVDVVEGCAPVQVTFTNTSSSANGAIASLLWGVGGTANVVSTADPNLEVVSTYTSKGLYSANLTVVDEVGCQATFTANDIIEVSGIPAVTLDVEVLQACVLPWQVQFSNLSVDPSVTYVWDFGNGTTYQGDNPPVAIFAEDDAYDLTIYMTNGSCADTVVYQDIIITNPEQSFEVSPTNVCIGAEATFTDISYVIADSVLWSFGDGNISTARNPKHSYASAGCYDIVLIRYTGSCTDTTELSCLTVLPAPVVNYTIDNQYSCVIPTTVAVAASASSMGTWSWTLPDGSVTTAEDPTFELTAYADYTLAVTFTDQLGCQTVEDDIEILIRPLEIELPTPGPLGCAPLTFTMPDITTTYPSISEFYWTIDGGTYTSTENAPSFTMIDTGRFDLQLVVVTDIGCADTVGLEDYISIGTQPDVDFSASPRVACKEDLLLFTDLSSANADGWMWYFDEQLFSIEQNPEANFVDPGIFDITLISSHNGCADTLTLPDYITIMEPDSEFELVYNCDDPYRVEILNTSTGFDDLIWTYNASMTDTVTTTTFDLGALTFADRGLYPISLYTYNDSTGCRDEVLDTIRIVDPTAAYTLDTIRGCAPLTLDIENLSQDADRYSFQVDGATIDTADIFNTSVTFTEGGILMGPTLIITDIHECQDTFQFSDSIVVNKLTAAADYNPVVCTPETESYLDASTDLLATIISWEWRIANDDLIANTQDATYTYTEPGLYDLELRVVDDWGCKDSLIAREAVLGAELIPDFSVDSLGCTWSPLRFIAEGVTATVGDYLWDFGDGNTSTDKNPLHTYAAEGHYTVCLTLFEDRGCSKQMCREEAVLIRDPIAAFEGAPLFATCPPLLTELSNTSENATSFIWDFGDGSGTSFIDAPSHVYTAAGTYDVTLMAEWTPTCIDTLTVPDYVVVEGPIADFSVDVVPTCLPQKITLSATSEEAYQYVWDYGNGVLDSVAGITMGDTIDYFYTEPGTYSPKLIVTNETGCTKSFSGESIRVDEVILGMLAEQEVYCGIPSTVTLENTSIATTTEITYQWQLTGPDSLTSGAETPTFAVTQPGIYDILLTVAYGGCLDTLAIPTIVEVGSLPTIDFQVDTEILCENVNATITNNSTITYGTIDSWLWQLPGGVTSSSEEPLFNTASTGQQDISLTAISDLGCEATLTASYDVLPSAVASAGEDQLICIGESTALTGVVTPLVNSTVYSWSSTAPLSCEDCLETVTNPADTAIYIFEAIHPNGCVSTDTVVVNVAPVEPPTIELSEDKEICRGAEATIVVVDFDPSYTYQWDPFVGGLDCYTNCPTTVASPLETTVYPIIVWNQYNCVSVDSVRVDVETSFEEFLKDTTAVCEAETVELTILSGTDPQWSPSAELSCINCSKVMASPAEDTYYTVEVSSPLGCRYQDSIWVEVIPAGSLDAGVDAIICVGETVLLSGTGFGQPTWSSSATYTTPNSYATHVTPDAAGYHYLSVTKEACTQTDSVYIDMREKAELQVEGDTICFGDEGLISATGLIDRVEWYALGKEVSSREEQSVSPTNTTTYSAIGYYRTCVPDSSDATVVVHDEIIYELPEDSYTVYLNEPVVISPTYDLARNYSFEWLDPEGLDCVYCPDPIISDIDRSRVYSVLIEDLDTGCSIEKQVSVGKVNDCSREVFGMANVMSLSGTGNNASFGPITDNEDEFISITIYDRWGNKIYTSTDVTHRWDGTFTGQPVAEGVYIYAMQLICPSSGKEYQIVGDVTVLR